MFGMTSKEFWEDDPQLYFSYRTFYLKKKEIENMEKMEYLKYESWLKGNMSYIATSISLNNAFSKNGKEFPKYEEIYTKEEKQKKKTKNEINIQVQNEWNQWARY